MSDPSSRGRRVALVSFLALVVIALLVIVALLATGVIGGDGDDPLTPLEVFQKAAPGVVEVWASFLAGGVLSPQTQAGLGSGFVVSSDGYILTNAHVVTQEGRNAAEITVVFRDESVPDPAARSVRAAFVGGDQATDVALLKVDPAQTPPLSPLPLGNGVTPKVGEPVVAIGSPLGFSFSASAGIVSATDRNILAPDGSVIPNAIQTDAAINSGNSGGPLIDSTGRVIGINTQIVSQSGGNQGLGFAVSIDTAVRVMEELKATGTATQAYLGAYGHGLNAELSRMLGIGAERGLLVVYVAEGSPAAQAGIVAGNQQVVIQGQMFIVGGDVITGLNDAVITNAESLAAAVAERRPGDSVVIRLVREGQQLEVGVNLATRPR